MATAADNGFSNESSPSHSGSETMVLLKGSGGRPITIVQRSDSDDSRRSTPNNSAKNSPAHGPAVRRPGNTVMTCQSIPVVRPNGALKGKASQEQIELRRLRTECRLLQQRIDNLEKEMTTMGKRLIQKQAKIAKQEEELSALRSTFGIMSPTSSSADCSFIPSSSTTSSDNSAASPSQNACSADDGALSNKRTNTEENVARLHRRIAELDQREVDACDTIRQLNDKIAELESVNEQLSEPQSVELLSIQDELVACKLRDAESNLALKELQQNVTRLEKHWQQFLDDKQQAESSQQQSAASTSQAEQLYRDHQQLREHVMALRLRETHLVSDLSEVKQKLMELETQNHIYERQIKRQEAEIGELKEKLFRAGQQEDELNNTMKELQRKIANLETKCKEDAVMSKIREAEYSQSAAVMRRRIAELEIENQELKTSAELQNREAYLKEMENRIQSLHDQLRNLSQLNQANSSEDLSSQSATQFEFSDDMTASFYNDLRMFSNPMSFDYLSTPPSFEDCILYEGADEPRTPTPSSDRNGSEEIDN